MPAEGSHCCDDPNMCTFSDGCCTEGCYCLEDETVWTIGILTIPERQHMFQRLMDDLQRQITEAHADDLIEVLVDDRPKVSIGEKRQNILDNADGEYLCFIDDDDLVAHNYIATILPYLDGVDYVGFQLQLYIDGKKQKPTYHSLKYRDWSDDADGYYRNVTHLNPMRTEIAREGTFVGNYGEDYAWSQQVHPHCETEHMINRPLYYYFYSPDNSESRKIANLRR